MFSIGRPKDDWDVNWVSLDGYRFGEIIGPRSFLVIRGKGAGKKDIFALGYPRNLKKVNLDSFFFWENMNLCMISEQPPHLCRRNQLWLELSDSVEESDGFLQILVWSEILPLGQLYCFLLLFSWDQNFWITSEDLNDLDPFYLGLLLGVCSIQNLALLYFAFLPTLHPDC